MNAVASAIERGALAARAAATRRDSGGSPGIVKVISGARSKAGAHALLRYVGRLGEDMSDPDAPGQPIGDRDVRLFDGTGLPIARDEARRVLESWELLTDAENLTGRAKKARDAGEPWAALPDEERLRLVQVRHLVYSAHARDAWEERLLEAATIAAVRETLVAMGHRAIVGMHREHGGHPHVHVIVRAANDDPGGERLRFRPDGRLVDGLRETFSRHCREVGLVADGSRWSDRGEVIAAAERGELPMRAAAPQRKPGRPVRRGRGAGPGRLAEASPDWWAEFGADALLRMQSRRRRARAVFEAHRAGVAPDRMPPDPVPAPSSAVRQVGGSGTAPAEDAGTGAGGLLRRFVRRLAAGRDRATEPRAGHGPTGGAGGEIRGRARELLSLFRRHRAFEIDGRDESIEALRSYARLRQADRGLADWYLSSQPIVFGPVTTGADSLRSDPELAALLDKLDFAREAPTLIGPNSGSLQDRRPANDLAIRQLAAREALIRGLEGLATSIERVWPDDAGVLRNAISLRDRAWRIEKVPLRSVLAEPSIQVSGGRDAPEPSQGGRGRRDPDPDRGRDGRQ
ncbi:MAG: hypothetical protein KAY22_08000 [Rhizorhabdus sp.]|uniref:hypothetical protein n=1 Tax=Rhizorhabdus sp. TaxID=1968843 RepID=UPI001B6AA430|nr:hypothetical protein [Rhizorhabdus sp.]MBP8232230.1 hypothetical protein [Rhizorhabdus sp.]